MNETFARQLKNFAYAVDIVDEESYLSVRKMILDYTRDVLDIDFTRQLILVESDGEHALMPYGLSTEGHYTSSKIYESGGTVGSQAAFCFALNQPLWIISETPGIGTLRDSDQYLDLWRGQNDIPPYRYPAGEPPDVPIKTSILIPLRRNGRPIGVVNFETREHLAVTESAKTELKLLTDTISMLYGNLLNHRQSVRRTNKALLQLNETLQNPLPKLTKPKIFLASSTRANADVIDIIKGLLEGQFHERLTLVYWKDMSQPGNINAHLLDVLGKCRYGICYLSEPNADNDTYRDNPNVIFEAGMLHGRCEFGHRFPASWIPVREEQSEIPPFDLTSERMVIVKRDDKGMIVDPEQLKEKFIRRIEGLLSH